MLQLTSAQCTSTASLHLLCHCRGSEMLVNMSTDQIIVCRSNPPCLVTSMLPFHHWRERLLSFQALAAHAL